MNAEPVTHLSISNNVHEHNKTSFILALNPCITTGKGIRDVDHSIANNAEIKVHMTSLLDEIKIRKGKPIKQYSATDTVQLEQDEVIQQSSEVLKLSYSLHSLHLAPNPVKQAEVTWSGNVTDNFVEQQSMKFKDCNLVRRETLLLC